MNIQRLPEGPLVLNMTRGKNVLNAQILEQRLNLSRS